VLNGETITSAANSSNNQTLQCYIISKGGEKGTHNVQLLSFSNLIRGQCVEKGNGGESSNSLKVLTYVERVK
jgi:hypothetical protein